MDSVTDEVRLSLLEKEAKWLRRLVFASVGMMGLVLFALVGGVYNTILINTSLTDLKVGQVALQKDVAALPALQVNVAALQNDVAALQNDVAALQNDVAALQVDVANIYTIMQENGTRQ